MLKFRVSILIDEDGAAYFCIDNEAICWLNPDGSIHLNEETTYKAHGKSFYMLRQELEFEIVDHDSITTKD